MKSGHTTISRRKFLAACGASAAALTLGDTTQLFAAAGAVHSSQIGMNLDSLNDWSTQWTFVDAFKTSRPWIAQRQGVSKWDTSEPIALTPDGYPLLTPGQIASTLMYREINGRYPGGRYVCQYNGDGKLEFDFDARHAKQLKPNVYEMDVIPSAAGIFLKILESDPKNPVRDIRLWLPGFEHGQALFHPLFLERLAPFGAIRFMDWQSTNGCPLAHWKDRTTPTSARQSGPNGGAVEYMVDLCNTLNKDAWFCMPHLADEDFVRQFATLVKGRLKPDRKIYVEWSNEVWNTHFAQTKWVNLKASVRGVAHEAIVAEMALRDWKIWHEVFGDQKNRVVRVAAGQHYGPNRTKKILDQLNGEFDAVSCAAYFDMSPEDKKTFTASNTSEDLIKSAMTEMKNSGLPHLAQHGDFARQWSAKLGRHIPFIAYEGGQGIVPLEYGAPGNVAPWARAAWDCQGHPMMKEAYQMWLTGFAQAGGELLMAFSYVSQRGKYGSWGHLQYQDDRLTDAPKYAALIDYIHTGG